LTDAICTGTIASPYGDVNKYLQYLSSRGVLIWLISLVHTRGEEEELLGNKIMILEWFMRLPMI
jgi:hypothetical protein